MWIKVKTVTDQEVFVNSDQLDVIYPYTTEDTQGCNLYFNKHDTPLEVKTTFNQIEMLLDVNSIEKCIDRLKIRNAQLEQKMQYDKIYDELFGARASDKGDLK